MNTKHPALSAQSLARFAPGMIDHLALVDFTLLWAKVKPLEHQRLPAYLLLTVQRLLPIMDTKGYQMGEKECIVYLDEAQLNRYRHFHRTERGQVMLFRIQYEAYIAGKWQAVVRYDTAHGFPHQDILHPDGTESKKTFPGCSNAEVLTLGQRDIRRNWKRYRHNYEREIRHTR